MYIHTGSKGIELLSDGVFTEFVHLEGVKLAKCLGKEEEPVLVDHKKLE